MQKNIKTFVSPFQLFPNMIENRKTIAVLKVVSDGMKDCFSCFFAKSEWGRRSMRNKTLCRTLGIAALSFGAGILLAFFLPETVLVVIEALLITSVGLLYFCQR